MSPTHPVPDALRLVDVVEHVYVVAYTEDTRPLEAALQSEGFESTVIRPEYTEAEKTYSQTVRVLLSHTNAWRRCAEHRGLTMVVEADFVPVQGLASLPLPFEAALSATAWGWLYTQGPVLYEMVAERYGRGHSASPVATLFGPETAQILLEFAAEEFEANDPHEYSLWDTRIGAYAKRRGARSYLGYRNYGEHGGLANPEHRRAGLTPTHRADVLWGKLLFLPPYARGSRATFARTRLWGKAWGIGRLVLGRYLQMATIRREQGWHHKWNLLRFSLFRLLWPY